MFDDLFFEGKWTYFYICVEAATNMLSVFAYFDGDEDSTILFQSKDFTLANEVAFIEI